MPATPCDKKYASEDKVTTYSPQGDGVCAEFPLKLIPLPSLNATYSGSRTVFSPGYTDEHGRSTPDGGTHIDTIIMRATKSQDSLPGFKQTLTQLRQRGWQQITPCQDSTTSELSLMRQVAGFETKDGWDLYIEFVHDESGADFGQAWTYTVTTYGEAAKRCNGQLVFGFSG